MSVLNISDYFRRAFINKDEDAGVTVMRVTQDLSSIYSGDEQLTPKFAEIDVASSGNNTVVSAVAGKSIVVLSYVLIANDAVTVEWRSGTSTSLSGVMGLAASAGISAPYSPVGHFKTTSGEALTINLGSADSVDGHLVYVEV